MDGQHERHTTPYHHPVFKGLGRKATFMGVPTMLFLGTLGGVAFTAMIFGLIWWAALFVLLPTIALITRSDDKAFDIWALEIRTRLRNRNKRFWNGSSYAPISYSSRRPWRKLPESHA
ncbi:VirB3 family type IV secretion system protein [Alcaligenaceae bacterium]|nr:VirB3 family type IV secretion system protein [Alcaligenaceae bacterium]